MIEDEKKEIKFDFYLFVCITDLVGGLKFCQKYAFE